MPKHYSKISVPTTRPGLYCIEPSWSKGSFKVGLATNLHRRLDSYCTCFPHGFDVISLLAFNSKRKGGLTLPQAESKLRDLVLQMGGQPIQVNCANRKKKTEWFSGLTHHQIHKAFQVLYSQTNSYSQLQEFT